MQFDRAGIDSGREGTWFYIATGSGVYLDLGRTRAFSTHADAEHAMRRNLSDVTTWEGAAQLDTIVFTDYVEHGMLKSEVLLLPPRSPRRRQSSGRKDACPPPEQADRLHAGWGGTAPCECRREAGAVNCGGLPNSYRIRSLH